ncbi:hypothetical protein C365_02343 [Cryptococcus neoformans Bt85]|nr:hypothetical protein C365_02343 [Cryptococcus neoformans var. grubii Bt85]OXM80466.1 hypothetical protein C364_02094 [Cryptococcus neoformans var. grubii Bt63]
MANLAAIVTAVVFGENLMNIFASQGEVVGQQILGVMVMGDWVVRREELSMEADTLAQETQAGEQQTVYECMCKTLGRDANRYAQARSQYQKLTS